MVQTLAHGLAQGRRRDLAPPHLGLGLGLDLAGDLRLFMDSCIHSIAVTPNQFALFGAQTALVWGISSFYLLRPVRHTGLPRRPRHQGDLVITALDPTHFASVTLALQPL